MSDRFFELTTRIMRFVHERDWDKDHDPKSLTLAITGEVGELAAALQWLSSDEMVALRVDGNANRAPVQEEMADVLIYLIELADWLGVDLIDAVNAKVDLNAENYPVKLSKGNTLKQPGRVFF